MRAIKLFVLCVMALLSVATAQAQWHERTHSDNGVWMEAGASVFDRVGGKLGLPLISNDVTKEVLFTSDRLSDLNNAVGPNIRFGARSRWGFDWEASTSFGKWDTSHSFLGPDLASPFIPPDSNVDSIGIDYTSQFFDLQFNLRKAVFPGMTFLIGPRYFSLTEDVALRTSTLVDTPFGLIDFQTQNLVGASNSGYGGTIGFEYNQPVAQSIYFQGHMKGSGLANQSRLDRSSVTTGSDTLSELIDKGSGMFVGQLGGRLYAELLPGAFATYAGYEATWVDGVAVASSQDFVVGGAETKTSNTIFWHAFTFGARFSY